MSPFRFVGKLPAAKSILNRLLLAQSYEPDLRIIGDNTCDDVQRMREGLAALESGQPIFCGSAGTVLRFLALRASREKGRYILTGSPRLFARPQQELLKVLQQVGVAAELRSSELEIQSQGWKLQGDTLLVPSGRSSQFASAVLLNAWGLPFDLYVSLSGAFVSEGYWRMSVQLAQELGMKIDFWDADFRVPKTQRVLGSSMVAETDLGSAFVIAALAAVGGHASIVDFPDTHLQPDFAFVNILKAMGVPLAVQGHTLKVEKAARLNGVAVNLRSAPDLFPVLAALCALADGDSELHSAPHLVHKESNRLQRLATWIQELGRVVEVKEDGIVIRGPRLEPREGQWTFDCDGDHRLAFTAAVFKMSGYNIEIRQPEVVAKSFPGFWQLFWWST